MEQLKKQRMNVMILDYKFNHRLLYTDLQTFWPLPSLRPGFALWTLKHLNINNA